MTTENEMGSKLKVWHIPNILGDPFEYPCESIGQAKKLLDVLAEYDLFLMDKGLRSDYSNASGVEQFNDGAWEEWNDGMGGGIDDYTFEELAGLHA